MFLALEYLILKIIIDFKYIKNDIFLKVINKNFSK